MEIFKTLNCSCIKNAALLTLLKSSECVTAHGDEMEVRLH